MWKVQSLRRTNYQWSGWDQQGGLAAHQSACLRQFQTECRSAHSGLRWPDLAFGTEGIPFDLAVLIETVQYDFRHSKSSEARGAPPIQTTGIHCLQVTKATAFCDPIPILPLRPFVTATQVSPSETSLLPTLQGSARTGSARQGHPNHQRITSAAKPTYRYGKNCSRKAKGGAVQLGGGSSTALLLGMRILGTGFRSREETQPRTVSTGQCALVTTL